MPFPPHAFSFTGGCNCGAIRYKVSIPDISERPFHAMLDDSAIDLPGVDVCRQSFVGICHCNNCRRATGSLFWAYIMLQYSEVEVSWTPKSSAEIPIAGPVVPEAPTWQPASEIFVPANKPTHSFLVAYASSPNRSRYFCSRCGTTMGYAVDQWPNWWKGGRVLDISLGTVDREYLEKEWMEPERALFWDSGIPWVKRATAEGFKIDAEEGKRWATWKPGEKPMTDY